MGGGILCQNFLEHNQLVPRVRPLSKLEAVLKTIQVREKGI